MRQLPDSLLGTAGKIRSEHLRCRRDTTVTREDGRNSVHRLTPRTPLCTSKVLADKLLYNLPSNPSTTETPVLPNTR